MKFLPRKHLHLKEETLLRKKKEEGRRRMISATLFLNVPARSVVVWPRRPTTHSAINVLSAKCAQATAPTCVSVKLPLLMKGGSRQKKEEGRDDARGSHTICV